MPCPTADMESCDKKCKCLGGGCDGLAYDCNDPCEPNYEFNEQNCECEIIYEPSDAWKVTYTYNETDIQPCAGLIADPCDVGGVCPTGITKTDTRSQSFGPYQITPTGWWQGSRYSSTNTSCPANTAPDTTTYADMGVPADWVVIPGSFGSYGGRSSANVALFAATPAALVFLGVDQLGDRWAWLVVRAGSGSVPSIWKGPGPWAFDIVATPA